MLTHEMRFAVREMIRRPGFTVLAVVTLGLGIGAVTTMFSVIQNVLLNPFPYLDSQRMVDVIIKDSANPQGPVRGALAIPEFRAFVDESSIFEEAIGTELSQQLYRTRTGVEPFSVAFVSPNSFRFLGVPALLGRTIVEKDAEPSASPVAVISHAAWMKYFDGSESVVGRDIVLGNTPRKIVGVMPPRFTWHTADAWIPDPIDSGDAQGNNRGFWLQGRLKRNVSLQAAEAELNAIGQRLAKVYPDRYPQRFRVTVITVVDWVVGNSARFCTPSSARLDCYC